MYLNGQEARRSRDVVDISVWENEGGAVARHSMYNNYGRRVEADGSWTIYHVFSGVPAVLESRLMTRLCETEATTTMIHLNARNAHRRKASGQTAKLDQPGGRP